MHNFSANCVLGDAAAVFIRQSYALVSVNFFLLHPQWRRFQVLSLEQGLDLHAEGKVRASLLRNSLSRVLLAQQEVVALELRDRRLYAVLCSVLSKFLPRTIHTKRR